MCEWRVREDVDVSGDNIVQKMESGKLRCKVAAVMECLGVERSRVYTGKENIWVLIYMWECSVMGVQLY